MTRRHQSEAGGLITFEGPEGAGKTTQIRRLGAWLYAHGHECVITREPGGTELGEGLRQVLKHHCGEPPIADPAEVLLFAASRAQLVQELIRPALARGAVVLCDRFIDSTTAYQGYGRGLDLDFIRRLNAFVVGDCHPRLTILLDLELDESRRRTQGRGEEPAGEDRIESETEAFHRRVRAGFQQLARDEPERIKVIAGGLPEDEVFEQLLEVVRHALGHL